MAQPKEIGVYPFEIGRQADAIGASPGELVAAIIGLAIVERNSHVRAGEPFIVLGVDGTDGTLFPYASFKTVDEARQNIVELETGQEAFAERYEIPDGEHGGFPLDRFYLFTRQGNMVSLKNSTAA